MQIETHIVCEETYTFTPSDGSPEVNIWSGKLRNWLHAKAMHKVIDLTFPVETLDEIIVRNGVELPRLQSMTPIEAIEPVIVGLWTDGTGILIDGAHRRAYWAKRDVHVLRGWGLPYEMWQAFTFEPSALRNVIRNSDGYSLPQRRAR